MQSQDLEYHNLDPRRGLFAGLLEQGIAKRITSDQELKLSTAEPPANTRAQARGWAVKQLVERNLSYVLNWDSIFLDGRDTLVMGNPFYHYLPEVHRLFEGVA